MIHIYSLREPSFSLVKDGKKTIEGRLNKNTFKKININDTINFYNYKNDSISVKVIDIRKYKSFTDMIDNEDLNKITPLSKSKKESIQIYKNIYNRNNELKFGVIALEISLI